MKIFLCGDVMTGRGIDQIHSHHVKPEIYEGYVKDSRKYVEFAESKNGHIPRNVADNYIWGEALSIWKKQNTDLKIINLETAITTNETFYPKGINYRMHPDNISVLKSAEIDICSLANNHIMDWSHEGLRETIYTLDRNKIKHSGAGTNLSEAMEPALFENKDGRIMVFSISHPSSGTPAEWKASERRSGLFFIDSFKEENVYKIRAVIDKHRKKDDVIILSIHWGDNWGYEVSKSEISFAHQLVDLAGVDIVHGHSSHHPKPIEIYKGHPILYGCGDFINDYEGIGGHEQYRADLVLMYFINFKIKPFAFQNIELICLKIKRLQLHRASNRDVQWMYETLVRECQPFALNLLLSDDRVIKASQAI